MCVGDAPTEGIEERLLENCHETCHSDQIDGVAPEHVYHAARVTDTVEGTTELRALDDLDRDSRAPGDLDGSTGPIHDQGHDMQPALQDRPQDRAAPRCKYPESHAAEAIAGDLRTGQEAGNPRVGAADVLYLGATFIERMP